jgi:hypothetical protein
MSFKRFDTEDITISAESIVAPAWTGQQTTISAFYTSSNQVASTSGRYYFDIYQTGSTATGAEVQFSVAYGNRKGSGSALITAGESGKSPSSIIYGQYRTLVNGDENTDFQFGTVTPNSIFTIAVNRSRYKEKLLPGTMNLILKSGSEFIKLTDNSRSSTTVSYVDAGRVFDLVSGSNGTPYTGTGFTPASGSYGKFLPDVGVFILNGEALKAPLGAGGFGTALDESSNSTSGSFNTLTLTNYLNSFTLQSEETVTSNYVFVRVRNSEFNYSTNPSIISGSGELRYDVMINSPQAYMTTIGLYNDNNDLLGVAKLSKPLLKDFTKEALVRIKLDY